MVLLVGFSLPLIAPLFASGVPEASLPACCRRSGKHHCMMTAGPSHDRTVAEKCPFSAFAGLALMLPHAFSRAHRRGAEVAFAGQAAVVRDVEAGYRISHDRTRQKRGPPSFLSL
jgi:hypothetical protein